MGNPANFAQNQPRPQVLGSSTSSNITPPDYSNLLQRQNDLNSVFDQEYENQMSYLSSQESGLKSQSATGEAQIANDYADVTSQLGSEEATKVSGVESELKTAETESQRQTREARDLFRQQEQKNIAFLSALGISSSSASEYMAEKLGVEVAKRLSGLSGSLSEIRQNAVKEVSRIKDFYKERQTYLLKEKNTKVDALRNRLNDSLKEITNYRNMAMTAKAQRRAELAFDTNKVISALNQKYEESKMDLAEWYIKKQSALQPLTASDYSDVFSNQLQKLQSQFGLTDYTYNPQVSIDPYGRFTGKINVNSKKTEDEDGLTPEDPEYWTN
jgi:hypothetical protein